MTHPATYGSATNEATDDFLAIQISVLTQIIEAAKAAKMQVNQDLPLSDAGPNATLEVILNANASQVNHSSSGEDPDMLYDGIMVSAADATIIGPMIDEAADLGIPVVTFETDAPNSKRKAFTSTNNTFMGLQMAKVLKQLQPEGGAFATISAPLGDAFTNRTNGFRNELLNDTDDAVWTEVTGSPGIVTTVPQAIEKLEYYANHTNATAIAIMVYPIFNALQYEVLVDRYRHKNITYIGIGDSERQLDLLARNYVHGLLGHLPYDWGYYSAQHLVNIMDGTPIQKEIKATNVVTHIQIPVELPELVVDHHRVGHLAIVGYVFFALASVTAIAMGCWVWFYRDTRVVKASQPTFLLMVALGIFIMNCGILPLGLDDSHGESEAHRIAICMSPCWLVATGFTIAFSALFSKTSRVNKIFNAGSAITRIKIRTHDVMLQCLVLLGANILILSIWTALDPLTYVRVNDPGTDGWNRVMSTSGKCQSNNLAPYLVPLVVINMACLGIANWQAYQGRFINSEFSEEKYIGIACISMMQTGLMGIPILVVVQDYPEALYLVFVSMIFVVSMAVLLLIFVPKIVLMENYSRFSNRTQGRMIQTVIREQTQHKRSSAPSDVQAGVSGLDGSHIDTSSSRR